MIVVGTPEAFLSSALIPVAVAIVFALSRKYLAPTQPDADVSADIYSYLPNPVLFNGCMIALGACLAFGIHTLLVTANRALAANDGPAEMILYPSSAIWWFLPGITALCLSWEITLQLWSCFSSSQARAYRSYTSLKAGFDSTRVLRWMGIVIVLPIAIATFLALPIHTTLSSTEISDGHFATLREDTYPYSEAINLTQFDGFVTESGFTARAGILIRFTDGRSWNSAKNADPKPQVDPRLVKILMERTGLGLRINQIQPK